MLITVQDVYTRVKYDYLRIVIETDLFIEMRISDYRVISLMCSHLIRVNTESVVIPTRPLDIIDRLFRNKLRRASLAMYHITADEFGEIKHGLDFDRLDAICAPAKSALTEIDDVQAHNLISAIMSNIY